MSAARPPEGARTAARQGEGTPVSPGADPHRARTRDRLAAAPTAWMSASRV